MNAESVSCPSVGLREAMDAGSVSCPSVIIGDRCTYYYCSSYYYYTLFLPRGKGVLQTAAVKGCHNPTPSHPPPPASRGQCTYMMHVYGTNNAFFLQRSVAQMGYDEQFLDGTDISSLVYSRTKLIMLIFY